MMTGIYGSAPGCLCTFPNAPACPGMEGKHQKLGQIATTVARPDRGYGGTYNYFDPDNWFSMSALIYSGEPFLQEQVSAGTACLDPVLCSNILDVRNVACCLSLLGSDSDRAFWKLALHRRSREE